MALRLLLIVFLGCLLVVGHSGCSSTSDQPAEGKTLAGAGTVSVYVTNYPLKYIAERIGGPHVEVYFPAPQDEDPAYWRPTSEAISQYQQADLILLNGAGYEGWANSVSLPESKVCNTSATFVGDHIVLDDVGTLSHGPEGEHAHGGTAFTTWLDPTLAVKQGESVCASLTRLQPKNADAFQANLASLKSDLLALDREISEIVASKSDVPVIFSHPVYQYFSRRYGLNGNSVHWEPDEMPTDAMWQELESLLAEHPARWMIWEDEPLRQPFGFSGRWMQ